MLPVRDQRPRAISLNHARRNHARPENEHTYTRRIPRYTGLTASKSESTVSRKREATRSDNTHSIWSHPGIDEQQHCDDAGAALITRKMHDMFSDVIKDDLSSWQDILFHLRAVMDQQASRIKALEEAHGIYRHCCYFLGMCSSSYLFVGPIDQQRDYKAELEAQKLALLDQQRQQFDALKHKYRIGIERIVDRWLTHEAEEQEKWMNTVKAQADERIARSEEQWKSRVAALEERLSKYEI